MGEKPMTDEELTRMAEQIRRDFERDLQALQAKHEQEIHDLWRLFNQELQHIDFVREKIEKGIANGGIDAHTTNSDAGCNRTNGRTVL